MSTTTAQNLQRRLQDAHQKHGYGFRRETAAAISISERQLARWIAEGTFNPSYATAEALQKHLNKIARRKAPKP